MSAPGNTSRQGHAVSSPPQAASPADLPALRLEGPVRRIGGGYETDVFLSADRRFALKLKRGVASVGAAIAQARELRAVAERFRRHLGSGHTVTNDYLVVAADGGCRLLTIQPFLNGARGLDMLSLDTLTEGERASLVRQLGSIVAGSGACFRSTGTLPDLYGTGTGEAAHARRRDAHWALHEIWHLVAERPLLTSYNLLFTQDERLVLVDEDPICHGGLLCHLIYWARALLLWRDRWQVEALGRGAP